MFKIFYKLCIYRLINRYLKTTLYWTFQLTSVSGNYPQQLRKLPGNFLYFICQKLRQTLKTKFWSTEDKKKCEIVGNTTLQLSAECSQLLWILNSILSSVAMTTSSSNIFSFTVSCNLLYVLLIIKYNLPYFGGSLVSPISSSMGGRCMWCLCTLTNWC